MSIIIQIKLDYVGIWLQEEVGIVFKPWYLLYEMTFSYSTLGDKGEENDTASLMYLGFHLSHSLLELHKAV